MQRIDIASQLEQKNQHENLSEFDLPDVRNHQNEFGENLTDQQRRMMLKLRLESGKDLFR